MDSMALSLSSTPLGLVPATSNAFSRLMLRAPVNIVKRDTYTRPTLSYNSNYDPYKLPSETRALGYSPYVFGEPLFNDRPVLRARLSIGHHITAPSKRARTA